MAIEVTIPRLGWSMEEGTFGEWLKRDGDIVERGEPLYVLEGEKSAQDIESVDRGILRIPPDGPRPGDLVRVGQVIAWFVQQGEAPPYASGTPATGAPARELQREWEPPGSGAKAAAPGNPMTSELAPRSPPVRCAAASPRARRVARELSIDLSSLPGTGRTGRIREQDVRAAHAASAGATASPRPAGTLPRTNFHAAKNAGLADSDTTAVVAGATISTPSRIRRTIAARMQESTRNTAPVTLHRRCDASNLVNLRSQFQNAPAGRETPTYTDLLVKLVGCVLVDFPEIRSQWRGEELVRPAMINVAVAVDTSEGLVAPVVRSVDRLTLGEVSQAIRELASAARSNRLSADDQSGGVFTITNLGAQGIDWFTPIINLPQAAILGLGRIAREAVVRDEQILIRDQLPLSLTFDHRVLDGAPAARFLAAVVEAIENPGPRLMP